MAKNQRERKAEREANRDRRGKAVAKHIRIAPSKVRIVLDTIRGKSYNEAVAILKNIQNTSAEAVLKVVESAASNAESWLGYNKADLYVAETYADCGPTLKRFQPVSKGRAHSILKRTCHITVIMDSSVKV